MINDEKESCYNIVTTLSLVTSGAYANCLKYNEKIKDSTFSYVIEAHKRMLKHTKGEPEHLIKQFKVLTEDLAVIEAYKLKASLEDPEQYKLKVKDKSPLTCYARNIYYFIEYSHVSRRENRVAFIKAYFRGLKPLPEVLGLFATDITSRLSELEAQIITSTSREVEQSLIKKNKLEERNLKLDELQELISKSESLKKYNRELEAASKRQASNIRKTSGQESPKGSKSTSYNKAESARTDKMASYATLVGRATACGIDPSSEINRISNWMSRVFIDPKMNAVYTNIFMTGVEHHMQQQLDGRSPDSCQDVNRVYNQYDWP